MNENQAERIALAFERMANYAEKIAGVAEKWYNANYPERKPVEPAKVTFVKDSEDQLLEDQGATGEQSLEDWTDIGNREREFVERNKK
jgi:hypothetical protein